jgi:hypothetical protein
MAMTLCVPPRAGEDCLRIQFLIRNDSTVLELTSRHRINGVFWDESDGAIALLIDIANPATSRPVDVRIDVVAKDRTCEGPRTRFIGNVERNGEELRIYGTYLGVVADED